MPEQSTEDTQSSTPWLGIAGVLVVLGIIVTVSLGSVEPPVEEAEPATVQHVRADLGGWDPFADLGRPDASATTVPDASEAD